MTPRPRDQPPRRGELVPFWPHVHDFSTGRRCVFRAVSKNNVDLFVGEDSRGKDVEAAIAKAMAMETDEATRSRSQNKATEFLKNALAGRLEFIEWNFRSNLLSIEELRQDGGRLPLPYGDYPVV